MSSSPPQERRDEVAEICLRHGARLVENEIYYDNDDDRAYALIELPDDRESEKELLYDLGASSWVGLVHADEKAEGLRPPPSGGPPEAAY